MKNSVFESLIGAIVLTIAVVFAWFVYDSNNMKAGGGYELYAKFDNTDGIIIGSDVKLSGIKVGKVVGNKIDNKTYLAELIFNVDKLITIPSDSSVEIVGGSLLGDKYISIIPGSEDKMLQNGEYVKYTKSAVNIESLIGKMIFDGGKRSGETN